MNHNRNFAMDLLRVVACFLVIHQHCAEQFYAITGHVEVGDDTFFIGINTSLGRICVPLFVMISGYFLLPVKMGLRDFLKRRLSRILIPFVVWYLAYCIFFIFYSGDTVGQATANFFSMLINFDDRLGHMWYIYMLVGLYLLAPIISPWLEKVGKRQMQFYLAIWLITTLIPYLNRFVSPEVWGACFWNPSPTFYYFTGFAGYFLLGYYVRRFGAASVWQALLLIGVGYIPTTYFYIDSMYHFTEFQDLEMSWNFCTLNVAMMTYGVFCLFTKIRWQGSLEKKGLLGWLGRLLSDFAQRSYGIYLFHIMVLLLVRDWLVQSWPDIFLFSAGDGYTLHRVIGNIPAVLIAVPTHAVITTVIAYMAARLLGLLPKSRRWLGV